jgi:hypothetical protein
MQKSRFLMCICFAFVFVSIAGLPAAAQYSFDNQSSGNASVEPAEKADEKSSEKSSEKADKTDSESGKRPENLYRLRRGAKNIEIVPGYAPMQPVFFSGRKEYNTDGRRLSMMNVRWTRTIGTRRGITYQYFFELTPLAVAFNNEVKNPKFVSEKETPGEAKTMRKTAYGFGFQPANFRFIFMPRKRVKPFVQIGAGMIFFNRKMPVPEATSYNFTGDFGGGLYIVTDREGGGKAVTLSYRYFHISNFNTSEFNPGYNANVFSIGYSFSRR